MINIPDKNLFKLDIKDFNSEEYKFWLNSVGDWDLFVSCIGTLEPIGKFIDVELSKWVEAVSENSTYQIAALINAIKIRSSNKTGNVILFAGGGTNSPNPNYSSYTLGKICLIKAVELLDNEINHLKFTILGSGWVKTKIHKETIEARENAGTNFEKTIEMINNPNKSNSMGKVIKDIFEIISLPKEYVGGRNFSSVHDKLTIENLKNLKNANEDFYKLRRNLN